MDKYAWKKDTFNVQKWTGENLEDVEKFLKGTRTTMKAEGEILYIWTSLGDAVVSKGNYLTKFSDNTVGTMPDDFLRDCEVISKIKVLNEG